MKKNEFLELIYEVTNYPNRDENVGKALFIPLGLGLLGSPLILGQHRGVWSFPTIKEVLLYAMMWSLIAFMATTFASGVFNLVKELPGVISDYFYKKGGVFKLAKFALLPIAMLLFGLLFLVGKNFPIIVPLGYITVALSSILVIASIYNHRSNNKRF